jgi:hypothetical protein
VPYRYRMMANDWRTETEEIRVSKPLPRYKRFDRIMNTKICEKHCVDVIVEGICMWKDYVHRIRVQTCRVKGNKKNKRIQANKLRRQETN